MLDVQYTWFKFVLFDIWPISRLNCHPLNRCDIVHWCCRFYPTSSILMGWSGPGEKFGLVLHSSLVCTSSLSGTLWWDQGRAAFYSFHRFPALGVIMSSSHTLCSGVTDVISLCRERLDLSLILCCLILNLLASLNSLC